MLDLTFVQLVRFEHLEPERESSFDVDFADKHLAVYDAPPQYKRLQFRERLRPGNIAILMSAPLPP
ncbi:MAG: hypothetical protein BWY57_03558 [Betaproteobacteria bacterium ADurb.Bin341]|nr:MAG: hypothetical protein BWY57_03558 [Betaproteobacteria bacterium ADurb.Bin341]